tara:strand:+ start:2929 stop:3117 length:189 start_codon:yes stop_codon:yes gene_type:complete
MKSEPAYFDSPINCPECGLTTNTLIKLDGVLMCDNCIDEREDWESDWESAYDLGEKQEPLDF